ncbi:MAG: 4-demethylwyosine synthase TYW1 [Candidatus Syntropharchaeia archaeon]
MYEEENHLTLLKKQGYHIVGRHSAVKSCLWLNRALRGKEFCYKGKFYGIQSHRCIQMTPSIPCNQRCLHCWRPIEIPFRVQEWDEPEEIIRGCLEEQLKLVSGYGGSKKTDFKRWEEAKRPKHVAISLIGEPTLYPKLEELIDGFKKMGMTTFLVTNGTKPDVIENIEPTQLYISLNAPDEDLYRRICNPLEPGWSQIKRSIEILSSKRSRTVIRITCMEGLNMVNPEGYAKIILEGEPDFVEVKAYMHLGYSRKRLERKAMPSHERIREFSERIAEEAGYKVADEVEVSRVVLLKK